MRRWPGGPGDWSSLTFTIARSQPEMAGTQMTVFAFMDRFASNSATSLVGADGTRNAIVERVYQYGNKIFNLDKCLPIVAMTADLGAIGNAPKTFTS